MDGTVVIGTELDTKGFEKQIEDVKSRLDDVQQSLIMASQDKTLFSTQEVKELEIEAEKLTNKLEQLKQKQSKIDNPPNEFLKGLKSVGSETNKVISKVGRWALAIFGIRSAYMFVRQAMSTLSQYDDQMATNVEYIRYLLASSLKPVIETLINLAYQLLQYLNMIMQSWFGINLFANATTEEFMKQKKEMGGTSKAAKELQKTLSGFDEMNILQEDGSSKVGGGGGGITMPNLPKMENVKTPEWMQWIVDHKDEIIAALLGIATAIGLINLGIGVFTSFGIGLIVAGLAYAILSVINYLNDPSWKNFAGTIQGIGGAIVGVGVVAGSVFAGLVGGVIILYGTIIKYWTEIKGFIGGIYDWFEERLTDIDNVFGTTVGNMFRIFIDSGREALDFFERQIVNARKIFDGIIGFVKAILKGDWKKAFEEAGKIAVAIFDWIVTKARSILSNLKSILMLFVNGLSDGIKAIINAAVSQVENMINLPINAINNVLDIVRALGVNVGRFKTIRLPRLAKGGIINMPGRGVPVGSAIAGERGQEGVIPLTDSQQMELLGQSIGKYITINANITNTMNGRVISKELQKIQAENDFAYNR